VEFDWKRTRFMVSAARPRDFPHDRGGEVAFAGRSNAGKSSALNAITGIKDLARVSKTPGRTQLVNFFELHPEARLVDLPGYGFAAVPDDVRAGWGELIESYLGGRDSLRGLVLVMDARHPLGRHDRELLELAAHVGIPVHALLTKADKLSRAAALRTLETTLAAMPEGATAGLFSSLKGLGRDAARGRLEDWLQGVG
jgi:GTP-binding protein